ncbi:uncharacterized protein LOC111604231 [Drosophila hydei]|uniref:Uncharacterized protein LOC111604231 n=1 Tax=Drosophila hydei TaxID=7224 RepID=A0A6J1MFY9_DROHY|nr:uncharacterized protein LOC111604231 [Drosophila hydei]
MATEIEKEPVKIVKSTHGPISIMPPTETHGIGDSVIEKPLTPCNSVENLSDLSLDSSFASCESFKTICKAWKSRVKSVSTMSLDRGTNDFEADLGDMSSRVDINKMVGPIDAQDLAKRLSLCVVLESRTLRLTDSSEDDAPHATSKPSQRFFEPDEIREAFAAFKLYDGNEDNYIELPELKLALEKLSVPQTHLAAKELMGQIVGNQATKMNFCQFLLTYAAILETNKSRVGQPMNSQLDLTRPKESVNVSEVGVSGAKRFFESKIAQQNQDQQSALAKEDCNQFNIVPNT